MLNWPEGKKEKQKIELRNTDRSSGWLNKS